MAEGMTQEPWQIWQENISGMAGSRIFSRERRAEPCSGQRADGHRMWRLHSKLMKEEMRMKLNNVRKRIAAIAAVALLGASGLGVSAMQDGSGDDGIMPLYYCVHDGCESLIPLDEICNRDYRCDGSHTHKWGFLWQNTCTVDGYYATAYSRCVDCRHEIPFDGEHYCLEVHDSCDRGEVSLCPFGG